MTAATAHDARGVKSTMKAFFLLVLLSLTTGASAGFDHDHTAWTALLTAHVREGRVDYSALHREPSALDAYLRGLEAVTSDELSGFTRDQRFAFWINAYNAYTVKLIIDHHPVASIRKVGGLFKSPFKLTFIPLTRLRREAISLDTIENDILRKEFADARLHAAIVCASLSCPELAARAYRAADLETQLDQAMRGFLADPGRNRWDPATRTLHLSSIFKWFDEDFKKSGGSVLAFVRRYAPPAVQAGIAAGETEIRYLDYDWALNGL